VKIPKQEFRIKKAIGPTIVLASNTRLPAPQKGPYLRAKGLL